MKLPRLLIPVVVFLAAGVAVAVAVFTGDDPALVDTSGVTAESTSGSESMGPDPKAGDSTTTSAAPAGEGPSTERMVPLQVAEEAMAIGEPDAPLVMVTFESFGCGWCGHFHTLTMPELEKNWVDTGKLRIESRMLPYEQRANPGALAGTAAGMQGKYWDLAEVMYPYITGGAEPRFDGAEPSAAEMTAYHQRQSEPAMLTKIQESADDVGLDFDQFMGDYRSTEAANQVAADTRMGNSIGFTSTPAMVVNGVPQGGFSSYESMDEFLTQVLASSETA
jgi:protein-disulfide isomerase